MSEVSTRTFGVDVRGPPGGGRIGNRGFLLNRKTLENRESGP
jgi:hypothetical protein